MTGLNVAYNYNPYQQIQFQVLNSRNGPSEEMYGDLERTKLPLVYTLKMCIRDRASGPKS